MNTEKNITDKDLRIFGLLVGSVFLIIGLWPILSQLPPRLWAIMTAFLLIIPALFLPRILKTPHQIWSKIGNTLGWFNTRLILSLLYLFAILPVAIILRLSGKTPLQLKYLPEKDSYREKPDDSESEITEQF